MALSDNLNAVGELVARYGFEMIALTLSRIAVEGHITKEGWEAANWSEIHDNMEAICRSYPTEHWRKVFQDPQDIQIQAMRPECEKESE
jgi:hypothetical protein